MIAIYDKRLPLEYINILAKKIQNTEWIPLDTPQNIYDSIAYHPDIYLFKIDEHTCIHAPCVTKKILNILQNAKISLICGGKDPEGKYPETAGYNALIIGKYLLHNLQCTDKMILETADKKEIKLLNIQQGYSRCSTIPVGDNGIITADNGIAKIALDNGFDVLTISSGHVFLPGQKYGFLGGATGILPDRTIIFIGDINTHPDANKIKLFLKKHHTRYMNIKNLPLYDAGTIMFFA